MTGAYTDVPLSGLRNVIAARMSEAKRTIPHFRIVADIDVGPLFKAREAANAAHSECKVTINDCLIRACALALEKHPAINAQLVGDSPVSRCRYIRHCLCGRWTRGSNGQTGKPEICLGNCCRGPNSDAACVNGTAENAGDYWRVI